MRTTILISTLRGVTSMLLAIFCSMNASGATCDDDCHARCRQCISYDLGFMKDEKCIIEPSCHVQCEAEKKAACAIGTPIPSIPITPTNPLDPRQWQQTCKAPFELFTHSTIAYCANWGGRASDLNLIADARRTLISLGLASEAEFSGVDIRWCPLNGSGMAPEAGRVLLNPDLKTDEFNLIATLAHEMHHIRQYRSWGGDDFKCRYSGELVSGKGQGRANYVERDAYEYEDRVKEILRKGRSLRVCNNSSRITIVAYGYRKDDTWRANGWYNLDPDQCKLVGIELTGVVYAYATANSWNDNFVWVRDEGRVSFCVDSRDAFDHDDSPCALQSHPDYRWAKFGVLFRGGYGTYTWNLGD